MFIHWGPSALWGIEIWQPMLDGDVTVRDYERRALTFNPKDFDAKEWVQIAKKAGIRYIVFVAKHHDGFSMFDSALTDYKITRTPFGRDIAAELAKASHEAGMPFGFYYSITDWHHPGVRTPDGERRPSFPPSHSKDLSGYVKYMHGQIKELLTGYGPLSVFWFDHGRHQYAKESQALKIKALVRKYQPKAIINDRLGTDSDFGTWEQKIYPVPERNSDGSLKAWETCMPIGRFWGYNPTDLNQRSGGFLVQRLAKAVSYGNNLLLNIGPTPLGKIQPLQVDRLLEMGRWLKINGESIYGAGPGPIPYKATKHLSTAKGKRIYLHILDWTHEGLTLEGLDQTILSARHLSSGKEVAFKQGKKIWIGPPPAKPDIGSSVVVLETK